MMTIPNEKATKGIKEGSCEVYDRKIMLCRFHLS